MPKNTAAATHFTLLNFKLDRKDLRIVETPTRMGTHCKRHQLRRQRYLFSYPEDDDQDAAPTKTERRIRD